MLEGICSKCGTHRYGWALLNPRYQTCPKCGTGLEILEDGHRVTKGFSPFTAERIDVKRHIDTRTPRNKNKKENK